MNVNWGFDLCLVLPLLSAPILTFPIFFPHFRKRWINRGRNHNCKTHQAIVCSIALYITACITILPAIFVINSRAVIARKTDELIFLAGALVHIGSHLPFAVYGVFDKDMYRAICRLLCHKRLHETNDLADIQLNPATLPESSLIDK